MTYPEQPGLQFRSPAWFGIGAGAVAFLICWLMNGSNELEYLHRKVAHQLYRWRDAALDFHKVHQRMPDSMDELLRDPSSDNTKIHAEKSVLDVWRHPIQYCPHSRNPEFISFGRDGLPGGVGVDADVSSNGYLPGGWPTLWQFTFEFGLKFLLVSLGIGVLGRTLYSEEVRRQRQSGWSTIPHTRLIFLLVITSLLTGVACAVLKIDKGQMVSAMCVVSFPQFVHPKSDILLFRVS